MSYWSKLSMKDKADVMRIFLDKGISDLDTMRREYNTFAEGGDTNDNDLVDWIIREEGFNKKPEDIGDGKITLGSGLTDPKWHALYKKRGNKWSAEDNRMAVAEEVANRRRWAEKNIPNWDTLPDSAQKALLSYKYNYNFTSANSPKLFQALADSNLYEAAKQMDATSKDPKFKKGLMDRRKREQEWFLSDVAGNAASAQAIPVQAPVTMNTSMIPLTEPAVSTAVRNNYVPATTTPYNRGNNIRRAFESAVAYNRMMDATSLQNNPLPEYPFPIEYADGGKIHIKPSHRGRLTELKERTGKSEAELYKTGGPVVRKMITFARNARKWKHGLGGNLYEDGGSYSYTKPLDNVFVDEYGNLLDPNVPSARGTVQLPEVIATTRDPRKYSSAYDKYLGFGDALYDLSRNVMLRGHSWGIGDGTEKISLPSDSISNEPFEGIAQATYLLPRDIQDTKFKDAGYTRSDGDYGLVKRAVGSNNVPVYQKRPDDISRDKLVPIGNINDIWLGKEEAELVHPGSYPTTIYIDPETNDLYQKGWDYNNYGSSDSGGGAAKYYSGLKKYAADALDMIGSPVVVTTGFSRIGNINNLDDYSKMTLNDYGILDSYRKKNTSSNNIRKQKHGPSK